MFTRKGSSKKRQKEETEAWVLEGIVEFLRSPTWTVPVINFIEQYCGEFENIEENKFVYTKIHKEYNQLVEELLRKYTEELSISSDQFARACEKNESTLKFLDGMFEYIWAAHDFLLFKDVMLKRNHQIEKETVNLTHAELEIDDELAEKEYEKLMAYALRRSQADFNKKSIPDNFEDDDLQEAIRFSKMEMECMKRIALEEKLMMEKAISMSLAEGKNENPSHAIGHGSQKHPISESTTDTIKSKCDQNADGFVKTGNGAAGSAEPLQEMLKNIPLTTTNIDTPTPPKTNTSTPTPPKSATQIPTTPNSFSPTEAIVKEEKTKSFENSTNNNTSVLQKHKVKNIAIEDTKVKLSTNELPPIKQASREASPEEAANEWLSSAVSEITKESNKKNQEYKSTPSNRINPNEVAKRKAHLKAQREKILEFKRLEREKELHDYNEAKDSCYDDEKQNSGDQDVEAKAAASKEKKMNARRALAAKLKREVVNKR